jgi:hypothetical protein
MSNKDRIGVDSERPEAEAFYSGAVVRITRMMPFIAAVSVVLAFIRFGPLFSLGLLFGCTVAFLNFIWLKGGVIALADRVTASGKVHSSSGIVLRFLVRYALIIIGCYVIVRISVTALYGLLAGLFLPVGAIACEAAYEVYAALWRHL